MTTPQSPTDHPEPARTCVLWDAPGVRLEVEEYASGHRHATLSLPRGPLTLAAHEMASLCSFLSTVMHVEYIYKRAPSHAQEGGDNATPHPNNP